MKKTSAFMRDQQGFTIVELSTAAVLCVIFALAFYAALYVMRNQLHQQGIFFTANRSVRFAMDIMAHDIREAARIVPTHSGNTTGNQVLILELPSINASGDATDIENDFDYAVYKLDPGNPSNLIRDLDVLGGTSFRNGGNDDSGKVVASQMQTLSFTSGGTALSSVADVATLFSVNASVTSRGTTLQASQTQTTQGDADIRLRNKEN